MLSKRAEMFLPKGWPAYYQKAKGVSIWDLDGNKYIDMSIMGIGACVLGYANSQVDNAVKQAIDQGNAATLNSFEEVELAEKLIQLHPWAEMVRFARTGGEACAIAVRIGRAASGKDGVAFCGYHGWHDWYLSANLADKKNLDGQLLPGLDPAGVPRTLRNSSFPFHYGMIEELESLVKKQDIGVIITEVERHEKINVPFLQQISQIARKIGAVVIYDEVSSGFRINVGGIHQLYGLEPDIAILGKAMGNGYPINAVIGKRWVMEAAQTTFISSTMWTERVGFVAALATIKEFETKRVVEHLTDVGQYLIKGLLNIFKKYRLNIKIVGLPSVVILVIKEENPLVIKTIFTQEMLKRGYLASTVIYVSLAHTKKIVDAYLIETDQVFSEIATAIKNKSLKKMLEGPVCHSGFKRLS